MLYSVHIFKALSLYYSCILNSNVSYLATKSVSRLMLDKVLLTGVRWLQPGYGQHGARNSPWKALLHSRVQGPSPCVFTGPR